MNFTEIIEQLKLQLQEIEEKEQANQQEQAEITRDIEQIIQQIEQLNLEIEQKYHRQSELDQEAIDLCRISEQLKEKQAQVAKIQSFSAEFQGLQAEFQGDRDLLDTLYSSITALTYLEPNSNLNQQSQNLSRNEFNDSQTEEIDGFSLSIDTIKANLPDAEKLYQRLVAEHLEQYHTYQNLIVNGLDLIWCSVAFVVFGKEYYRKMSLKYHPDKQGSAQAMQLINTAWEISQQHINS